MSNLAQMSDTDLFVEAVGAITRAAYGESQGGDQSSYDYAMELMHESRSRLVAAGHASNCNDDIYTRAHRQAVANNQFTEPEPTICTCGAFR